MKIFLIKAEVRHSNLFLKFSSLLLFLFFLNLLFASRTNASSIASPPVFSNTPLSASVSYFSCPDTSFCAPYASCWNDEAVNVTHCGPLACPDGSAWTKYNYDGCATNISLESLGVCIPYFTSTGTSPVYSTADKCIPSDGPYLRAGYCDGSYSSSPYKVCCDPSGGVASGVCVQVANDTTNPPWEGVCPAGSYSTSPGVTTCPVAFPGPPQNTTSASAGVCNAGGMVDVTFSFIPGSGATYHQVRYNPDSVPGNPTPPGQTVQISSGQTIQNFSVGGHIYYNIDACNSGGCTPDPNGEYRIDLPTSCSGSGPTPTFTPTPTPNSSFCNGSCTDSSGSGIGGTACTPSGGGSGTWQWNGVGANADGSSKYSNCDNVRPYCYTCVGSGPTPTGPPSCGSLGTSCAVSGCCTSGSCIGGICRVPTVPPTLPPACRTYGQACGSGCCAGLVCNAGACLNPTPTPVPRVTIQGHFVDANGNDLALNVGQSVTINSNPPTSQSNSIFWSNLLPTGTYTVRAAVPANYIVTSSTCVNCTTHSSYSSTNPVVVNLPSNGNYADIYFRYALNTCTTTFNGNVVVDPTTTDCSSLAALGGTAYTGSGQVSAYNGSTPPASTVAISGGVYSGLSYAPICGSASYLTLSGVIYPVIGVCDGSTYTAQTSYTFPYTNTNSPTANRNVTFLVTSQGPWFQVDTGDVRFPDLSNKVPRGQKASASDKSLFASSTGNVNLWSGTFSLSQNWQVNQEYAYNSDFKNGLGSMSYTFYVSRARQRQLLTPNNISGSSVDLSTLSSNVYQTDGNLTITASSGITGGKHIVLLVKGNATINGPISVPAGQNNLFVLATKGNLTFAPTVGTATLSSTATSVDGYYTAEGNIILSGGNVCPTSDLRLNVGGALIANSLHPFAATSGSGGKIINNRNLCSSNLTQPAYYVSPRADFLFQLTDFYKIPYKTVREVEP